MQIDRLITYSTYIHQRHSESAEWLCICTVHFNLNCYYCHNPESHPQFLADLYVDLWLHPVPLSEGFKTRCTVKTFTLFILSENKGIFL